MNQSLPSVLFVAWVMWPLFTWQINYVTPMGWTPFRPVSYTHLDVYKRQVIQDINSF